MRLGILLATVLLLSLALGRTLVAPGEAFTLAFSGVRGGITWRVEPFQPLLLPEEGEGLVLAVLEAPPSLTPGVYPVCLSAGETALCQEVEVPKVERLWVQVPPRALGVLPLRLANRGNVPLGVSVASAPESQVFLPPLAVEVGPGEEREVSLPLEEGGVLLLVLSYGDRKERYLVQVESPGGAPPPYRLGGSLALGYPGPYGALALEGPLARGASFALRMQGEGMRLGGNLGLSLGPWGVFLNTEPGFGLSYQEGPLRLGLAYPWRVEGEWKGGEGVFRLEATPELLRLGYALWGFSLRGQCTLEDACRNPSLRLERMGEPAFFLAWEGGLLLGGSVPGFGLEASLYPQLRLRGSHFGTLGEAAYRVEGVYDSQGGMLWGRYAWPLDSSFRLALEAGVGQEARIGAGLSYRRAQASFSLEGRLRLDSPQGSLGGVWEWEEGPYGLRLEGFWSPQGTRFGLEGRYTFSLSVPPEVTQAFGGYDRLPLEGVVVLGGKPLGGARIVVQEALAPSDAEGRFRIFLPRAGGRLRVFPPPDTLALPLEVEVGQAPWNPLRLELPPASHFRLVCAGEGGKGAYVAGQVGAFVACGSGAVLPPGIYRVWPEALPGHEVQGAEVPQEVRLVPLEETTLSLPFRTTPSEVVDRARPLSVRSFPSRPAPGEEVRLEVEGATGKLRLLLPGNREVIGAGRGGGLDGPRVLTFQVPWEARGALPLRLEAQVLSEGREVRVSQELVLPLDEGRKLLQASLLPPRASLGEEVEVSAEVRFPAEEVFLHLPTGKVLTLAPAGQGRYVTRFVLDEALAQLAEPVGRVRGLSLRLVARQGERQVEERIRLLLR
ncbi:hypothetical protein [Thermus caldifontis]|uniref:hypothetical protein n=1 Tax=Thermus caldifontis TaxID=1930763 RepID=UPI000DF37CC3|nr:hypothetical protein [Thermus caldifontis]